MEGSLDPLCWIWVVGGPVEVNLSFEKGCPKAFWKKENLETRTHWLFNIGDLLIYAAGVGAERLHALREGRSQ